ncbi:Serine/threonine-protein kinase fray2 [Glycine soja]
MGGYSTNPADYKLLEEIGYGATATVYRAMYLPFNQLVAIKSLDLDRCNINLDDLRREAQTMSLIDHPNVVRAHCSFAVERSLWVVMPFMDQGSCLHLIKIALSHGFQEDAIGSILKETLKALHYLHRHGHIHRDVKAGNILLDTSGAVKLSDFGVATCLYDAVDRQRCRNTFVGTPCWMAPEVLQPAGSGYNSKADIWSFGITALELAHGHAPFSKYPPMKVLLMTMQNAPPGLDDRDKKFSKSFKEMVAMCLVKDQTKRPSAEKLLKHSFFKHAKPPELSVKKLFADLPPLWNCVKSLKLKDAAQLAVKKMPSADEEAISQSQYQRGVSAWNFDIDDLKAQASLVMDDNDNAEMREDENKFFTNYKASAIDSQSGTVKMNTEKSPQNKITSLVGAFDIKQTEQNEYLNKKEKNLESDLQEPGLPRNIIWKRNGSIMEATTSTIEKDIGMSHQTQSGLPGTVLSHSASERRRTLERLENGNQLLGEKNNREARQPPSFSGTLMLPTRASANSLSAPIKSSGGFRDSLDDKSKATLVQIKGRFSVTSENLDLVKDIPVSSVSRQSSQGSVSPLRKSASVSDWMLDSKQMATEDSATDSISASLLTTHLQNLLQQTSIQQDLIMNLLNSVQSAEAIEVSQNGKLPPLPRSSEINGSVDTAASERERLLLLKILELQTRIITLTDELTAEKLKYMQLQQQLTLYSQEQNMDKREEIA